MTTGGVVGLNPRVLHKHQIARPDGEMDGGAHPQGGITRGRVTTDDGDPVEVLLGPPRVELRDAEVLAEYQTGGRLVCSRSPANSLTGKNQKCSDPKKTADGVRNVKAVRGSF